MTTIHLPPAALESCLTAAHAAGVDREQIARFLRAGYIPQPKQLEFHAACRLADVPGGPTLIGYGGARGPGKSHASVAQAAIDDCQRVDGLKVLFLRKVGKAAKESFGDLRQRALRYVPHGYSAHAGRLLFPNGSLIVLGNFYNESDIDKYLGIEYDLIIIEEATQLSEEKFKVLRGSLRTSKPNWRPRMYLTTNPGGIGHQWFKRLFVLPWRAGRQTEETRFIPGTWRDNHFLNREYTDYLLSLTGVLGRMWRDGDWDIGAGQFFVHWSHERHVVRPFAIPEHWPLWASLDYGYSHPTAVYIHTAHDGAVYTIAEHVQARWLPPQHAAAIKAMVGRIGHGRTRHVGELQPFVAGRDAFAQRADSRAKTVAQQYAAEGITLTPANDDRIAGAAEMLRRLGDPDAGIAPTWKIFDTCARLIECLPGLQSDPRRPEDVLKVDASDEGLGGDDEYDGARYGLMVAHQPGGGNFGYRYK